MAYRLKGWRFGVFIGAFVSAVCGTMYFSAIAPMLNPEPYSMYQFYYY